MKDRPPPKVCPRCGQSMEGRNWHSYLGHWACMAWLYDVALALGVKMPTGSQERPQLEAGRREAVIPDLQAEEGPSDKR